MTNAYSYVIKIEQTIFWCCIRILKLYIQEQTNYKEQVNNLKNGGTITENDIGNQSQH